MSSGAKKRRVSGSSAAGGAKAIKLEPDLKVPVDALLKQHVRHFDQWLFPGSTLPLLNKF